MKIKRIFIALLIRSTILLLALKTYASPGKAAKALKILIRRRASFSGVHGVPRYFKANGRYFFGPNTPGWPSESFNRFIINELNECFPSKNHISSLTTLIFSITTRCPLRCKHCFEWDRLDSKELLSVTEVKSILSKFQEYGVSQVQIGGGEPMERFDDLTEIIQTAQKGTDFWLLTSGFNLTMGNAIKLRKAGMTGVRISLDDWDKEKHNEFRGSYKAFDWALTAAENCKKAGLSMGLSICITKEFLSEDNLDKYLKLAKTLNADFVIMLEPRETGHFKNKDVSLSEDEITLLDSYYLKLISSKNAETYPIVVYPGFHQRRIGCSGAGIRYLYVDSAASVHACPFCQGIMGNALNEDIANLISKAKMAGCQMFPTAGTIMKQSHAAV
jgi:MoaA/NifB/PqqE/SkfB family radical SAM enzyme